MTDTTAPVGGLYSKLADVMAEVGKVQARGTNDFLRTKYVTEGDLLDAVRDKLAQRRVVLVPSVMDVSERAVKVGKAQKDSTLSTVRLRFTFCDGDTGETCSSEWLGSGEDPTDKAVTMAYTSALRTFLLKMFLVSSTDEHSGPPAPASAPASGGVPITQEQVNGIAASFAAAGKPIAKLEAILDKVGSPRERAGTPLGAGDRIAALNTTEAIAVQKQVAALPAHQEALA